MSELEFTRSLTPPDQLLGLTAPVVGNVLEVRYDRAEMNLSRTPGTSLVCMRVRSQ